MFKNYSFKSFLIFFLATINFNIYAQGDCSSIGTYDYGNNEDFTNAIGFIANTPGDYITIDFTAGSTETCCDTWYINDAANGTGTTIASGNGSIVGSYESTTGEISFYVDSDGSVVGTTFVYSLSCAPPPSCTAPTNVTVSNITSNSADISWTSSNSFSNLEYGANGFTQGTGTLINSVSTNPYTLTGLSPGTNYDLYIQDTCGNNGASNWVGPISIRTSGDCSSIGTYDYDNNEDFTNAIGFIANTPGDYITIDFTAGSTETCCDTWYINDAADGTGTTIASGNGSIVGSYESTTGEISFYVDSDGSVVGTTFVYSLSCAPPPSCTAPTNVTASNATSSSVDISWTSSNSFSNIEYGANGFTQGTGTLISSVSTNPYTLTGLNPATSYDFYIQDTCGNNGASNWVGPISFVTLCNTISTMPYLQNFDTLTPNNAGIFACINTDNISDCWNNDASNTNNWTARSTATGSGNTGPSADHTGGGNYVFLESSSCNNISSYLLSAEMDISSLSSPLMSFWYHMYGASMGSLSVEVSTDLGVSWSGSLWSISGDQSDQWREATIDLSSYVGSSSLMVRFEGITGSSFTSDMAIDDFIVQEAPSCPDPLNVTVINITSNSVDISWSSSASFSNIEYGTTGFNLGSGNLINSVATNPYTLTGLNPSTSYDFYIQDTCGNNGASNWVGPISFTTDCQALIAPWTESYDGTSTPICWSESGSESWNYSTNAAYAAGTAGDHTGNGGNYAWIDGSTPNGASQISTLSSPFIDISAMSNPTLDYWIFSNNTDDNTYNTLLVDFWDGSNWTQIDSIQESLGSGWVKFTYNLNTFTISGNVKVRFTIREDASGSAFYNDILIDDVSIYEPLANDLAAITAYSTEDSDCELSDSVTICIDYINNGTASQYSPMMEFTLNGGAPVTETTTDTINPGDTANYCFTSTVDLSIDGTYDFVVSTNLMGDADSTNNSFSFSVTNETTPSAPAVFGDTACENSGDTLMLIANGTGGSINWYDAASGGNLVGTGDTLLVGVNTTTSFYASVTTYASSQVHITEADLGSPDMVEIQNTSNSPVNVNGWRLIVSDDYTTWTANSIEQVLSGTMNPGDILYWTDDASINYWGNNLFFNGGSPMWALLVDSLGSVMDFMCVEWTASDIANATIITPSGGSYSVANLWDGDGVSGGSGSSVQRIGSSDNDNASDWTVQPTSTDSTNSGLVMPLFGGCPSSSAEAIAFIDPCASINEIGLEGFSLFPNPNNGEFNVVNNGKSELIDISIFDIQGKTVYNQQFNFNSGSQRLIELNGIEKGIYLVKLNSDNGYKVFNIIIQ